jgi:hypothetical protein
MSRDYEDEYNKFQKDKSSYRAKLNKYNRDKGTYGNGDGKDASHKKGEITGFVESSKNKSKKEKSRLKGSKRKKYAAEGGKLKGPSHDDGGIDINVEGDEIIINKTNNNAAGIHEKELLALNDNPGDYVIIKKDAHEWPSQDARQRGEKNANS